MSEGRSEVKERLGWVAISDTSWARLRWPVSVQASVSHMDTLSPALHCGSCLKGAGAGQGCGGSPCGKEAEKAKPHRGSYLCRSWGWWWDGGDGGAGAAGAAVLVTVPDSTALFQQTQGKRTGTGRGRESASLGITWAVERKPCGIWPLLRDPGGGRAGHSLARECGCSLDRCHLPGVCTGHHSTGGKNSIYFLTQAGEALPALKRHRPAVGG